MLVIDEAEGEATIVCAAPHSARSELDHLLDAIAQERGVTVAHRAAVAVRRAIAEGRIDGPWYDDGPGCGCVIGHLARALGWPGWPPRPAVPGDEGL
jgi:hypothetical protein